jgi:glycerol kinase
LPVIAAELMAIIAAIGITIKRNYWGQRNKRRLQRYRWQDRRTQKYCDELKAKGHAAEMIQNRISFRCLFSGT